MPLEIDESFLHEAFAKAEYIKLLTAGQIELLKEKLLVDIAIAYKEFALNGKHSDSQEFEFTYGRKKEELSTCLEEAGISIQDINSFLKEKTLDSDSQQG